MMLSTCTRRARLPGCADCRTEHQRPARTPESASICCFTKLALNSRIRGAVPAATGFHTLAAGAADEDGDGPAARLEDGGDGNDAGADADEVDASFLMVDGDASLSMTTWLRALNVGWCLRGR